MFGDPVKIVMLHMFGYRVVEFSMFHMLGYPVEFSMLHMFGYPVEFGMFGNLVPVRVRTDASSPQFPLVALCL